MSHIKTSLKNLMIEKFHVDPNDKDFTDTVDLFDYGYLDSFMAVEMREEMEKIFKIKITDRDLVQYPLNTIEEIANYLEEKTKS